MMTALLWLIYPIAIQYERGGLWRAFYLMAAVGLVIDVIANYTELTLLTLDWPKRGEWTFSKRLKRLVLDAGWRGSVARYVAKILDVIAPSGKHIDWNPA